MNYRLLLSSACRVSTIVPAALLMVATCTLPKAVVAEDAMNIATVDINALLNELDEAKSKKADLDKATATAKKDVDSRRAELASLEKSLREKKVEPGSAEGERFRQKVKDFERYVRDTEEKLRNDFLKTNNDLSKKVLAAVEEYASDNNIDLVLEKSGEGRGAVLYGRKAADITPAILEELNG